jgi:iron complex outermembrane receptor protein
MSRCRRPAFGAPVFRASLAAFLLLALCPAGLRAQAGQAVSGSVVDSSGGSLPGAGVTLVGPGPVRFAATGNDGHYHFAGVGAGTYKLTVTLPGFLAGGVDQVTVGSAPVEVPPVTLQLASRGEDIVVTASKTESSVVNAPVSVSVISSQDLENAPVQNYGDILREVPGMNVIQMSARDINVTSREPTNTLSNSQLALLDGRTIYLDFFGLILWDYLPTNPDEIKQIEVIRGPASAVWGANAMTGVVNIITKSPREMSGGSVMLQGGGFSRDAGSTAGQSAGAIFGAFIDWAQSPSDTISYRLSGGYYYSDAYPRPVGTVPIATNPADPSNITGGGVYPPFPNAGTKQPKFDARVDQELDNGGRITYEGGYAGTSGIIYSGIGPFSIQPGSYLAFGRVGFTKGSFKLATFGNFVDTTAPNLLQVSAITNQLLQLNFKTQTYDIEAGNANSFGTHNLLTYGGNARWNDYNITITPNAPNQSQFGAYVQDEIIYDHFRFNIGGRVDKFSNLDHAVFSPRLAAILKPNANQSFRLSFNKAFRAPSLINNSLDITTYVPVNLSGLAPLLPPPLQGLVAQPFPLVVNSLGSDVRIAANAAGGGPPLKEESVKAYEVGYTGTFGGKTTVDAAFYINDHENSINFITDAAIEASQGITGAYYTPANPPPGWQLPPALIGLLLQQGIYLPAQFTYLNLGPYRQKGIELGVQHTFNRTVNGYVNYSYQFNPEVLSAPAGIPGPFPAEKLAYPPNNRVNAGVNYDDQRFVGNLNVNYTDKAFWTDVLNDPYHGYTNSYTMLNAAFGVKWAGGRLVTTIKSQNLTNETIQQHVFGDIIKRSIYGEVKLKF